MALTLNGNVAGSLSKKIDSTLAIEGAAADAKAVGDALKNKQSKITSGTTDLQAGISALATGEVYVVYE